MGVRGLCYIPRYDLGRGIGLVITTILHPYCLAVPCLSNKKLSECTHGRESRHDGFQNTPHSAPTHSPVSVQSPLHFLPINFVYNEEGVPLDKHNTLTLFSLDEFVMPTRVGPKNITSSSGCAITKRMLRPEIGAEEEAV